MAPHSSTLAWKIPWTEEPSRLQSMGLLRAGHNWVTSLWLFTFMYWRRKWRPTPVFLPGESQGCGSLVGCRLWGCTVGHDWSNLAAAEMISYDICLSLSPLLHLEWSSLLSFLWPCLALFPISLRLRTIALCICTLSSVYIHLCFYN